jgi:hypothetical protein
LCVLHSDVKVLGAVGAGPAQGKEKPLYSVQEAMFAVSLWCWGPNPRPGACW